MRLEDYFEFVEPDYIRIKGHRIGIESILRKYLEPVMDCPLECRIYAG
jgi:hypothetical protein